MNARPISRSEFFASIGRGALSTARDALRSRVGQTLVALSVAAVSIGLAILIWNARDQIAGFAAAGFTLVIVLGAVALVYFGLLFAGELLPFSEKTRARWARERELSDRYPSYRWRNALWAGLIMGTAEVWKVYHAHTYTPAKFLAPAILVVVGIAAQGIWHFCHRDLERD